MRGFRWRGPHCSRTIALRPLDVIVAGGGPAGVALATRLKRFGYDVALIVAPTEGAHRVETLNPAAQTQLEFEGLAPETGVACEFKIRWGAPDFERRAGPSILIDRRVFHEGLRRRAAEAGVKVVGGRAQELTKTAEGWQLRAGAHSYGARLLADATGRRGIAGRTRRRGPLLIGLHTVWTGENLPRSICVAAVADGWLWGAPMLDGCYAISVFQDPRQRKRGDDLASRIARVVARSEILMDAANLRIKGSITAEDATSSCADTTGAELSLFRVGDAAVALDPLSSSGVQSAVQSAIDAALAIHTFSQDPSTRSLIAAFLDSRAARRAARHAAYTAGFYGAAAEVFGSPFWAARAGSAPSLSRVVAPAWDQRIALSDDVRLRDEPCLVGDRIVLQRVVAPPSPAEPVAFVEGVEIAPLFDLISSDATTGGVIREWSASVGEPRALRLFWWAWRAGLLAPDSGPQANELDFRRGLEDRPVV
jgi:flavin-dependent dehydrogenase